jgi:hypothetical protein
MVFMGQLQKSYAADACIVRLDTLRDKKLFYRSRPRIASCKRSGLAL